MLCGWGMHNPGLRIFPNTRISGVLPKTLLEHSKGKAAGLPVSAGSALQRYLSLSEPYEICDASANIPKSRYSAQLLSIHIW